MKFRRCIGKLDVFFCFVFLVVVYLFVVVVVVVEKVLCLFDSFSIIIIMGAWFILAYKT